MLCVKQKRLVATTVPQHLTIISIDAFVVMINTCCQIDQYN